MKNPSVCVSSILCGLRRRVLGNFLWISDFKKTILSRLLRGRGPNFLLHALTSILLLSATPQYADAQDLYVGSNSSGQITNFSSETYSYENTYVGYNDDASNNLLIVGSTNTLLTNSSDDVLRFFPLLECGSRADALGYVGMPARWLPPHVSFSTIDAANVVGRTHGFPYYLGSQSLTRRICTGAVEGLGAAAE
jgi:hypothetical protein